VKQFFAVILVLACFGIGYAQDPSPDPSMKKPMSHMKKEDFMAKLKLTDDQKKQMKELKFETDKKAIDLRSKLELSRLELSKLLSSDTPDKDAIEKQINEVAANETAVHMNRLDGWFEANKILTPEQQKQWRKVLREAAMAQMGKERSERRNEHHRP